MNLRRLVVAVEGCTQIASRHRRLQRFFREVHFDYDALARLLVQSFGFMQGHYYRSLTIGQSTVLRKVRHINDQPVWLSALRLEKGGLLIVASNQKQQQPFEIYGKRWAIETLFQALKKRGFNREDTRLTHYFRI